jgi:DeoR/GlpR family transcriptional regulator of sugar metabolism
LGASRNRPFASEPCKVSTPSTPLPGGRPQQVQPGETILLDAGTTVGAMSDYLRSVAGLTVVTAGLTALEALADADAVRVECIGGTLRHLSQGFVGPLAEATLERLTFDRAFLGADAVNAELGICEAELEPASKNS